MSMRIETPMALARPVEATTEKARELDRQSLNPTAMRHEESVHAEKEARRPQAAEETEGRRINADDAAGSGGAPQEDRPEPEAGEPEQEQESDLQRLNRRAARQWLGLSVEPSKKEQKAGNRLDITL